MSVIIKSGASSDLLTIEPTSKGARSTLYPSGSTQELAVSDGVAFNTNHRALITGGVNDDNIRISRADRLGSQCVRLITPLFNDSFLLRQYWSISMP